MRYYFLALGTFVLVCVGCASDGHHLASPHDGNYHAPPAAMLAQPGPMVAGPGPGVMPMLATNEAQSFESRTTQIRFVRPDGMRIGWQIEDGYAENQLEAPGRWNFAQAATYRLKLTDIPGHEMDAFYPTLQVYPAQPETDAYLSHNSVPLELTDEDLDQVVSNNFVTKVIYLPDSRFQELAIAGVETLVSTRLEPGVDPVDEADRRGTILAILRLGNMDLEMPSSDDEVTQVSHRILNGDEGEHAAPMPIATAGGPGGVPNAMIVAGGGVPGMPSVNPISGVGNMPVWGMTSTSTPIGLPGPPHLPLGQPAGLRSHTVRNLTKQRLPSPTDHMLIDVEHEPGLSVPKPVKYIHYKETHPNYRPDQVSYPAFGQ